MPVRILLSLILPLIPFIFSVDMQLCDLWMRQCLEFLNIYNTLIEKIMADIGEGEECSK